MKKLAVLLGVLVCGQVFAEGIDPAGIYTVKTNVIMSSCADIAESSSTNEQWVVNPTNTGYRVQVVGNANPNLAYNDVGFYPSNVLYGRYTAKDMFGGEAGTSEIQVGFAKKSKSYDIRGFRVIAKFPPHTCTAVIALQLKKTN